MTHTTIASMIPGETFTYYTGENGEVSLHSRQFNVPAGKVDTGLRYRYGASNIEHQIHTAPADSYTVVLYQDNMKYATRTYITR